MPNEICQNPFKHKEKCTSTDIVLYIVVTKRKEKVSLPICRSLGELYHV